MIKYRLTVESEDEHPESVVVQAWSAKDAVAIARARGDLPLDRAVKVKNIQYSENGEIVHTADPTDETRLQTELLSILVTSEIIQRPFSVVFWPVAAALGIVFLFSLVLSAAFSSGY